MSLLKKVLVVEDDPDINNMLIDLLTRNNYEAFAAFSGTEALMCLERQAYDLILLDLMLPGLKGHDVLQRIPEGVPVIAVSAIDDTSEKIRVLRSGAVDYVTKPFDNGELLARMEAHLRRNASPAERGNRLVFRDIVIDTDTYAVTVNGAPIGLTKREYMILKLLVAHPKKVFTKSNIYRSVWDDEFYGDDNTINVHISNLRTKLQKAAPQNEYIQTVWGVGFKLQD